MPPLGEPDERLLVGMWVDPAYRGRGVAQRLIIHVAEWARRDGAAALRLNVGVDNVAARTAYRRAGFLATGALLPNERDPGTVEESFRMPLADSARPPGGAANPGRRS